MRRKPRRHACGGSAASKARCAGSPHGRGDRYCIDIVTQISAVRAALRRARRRSCGSRRALRRACDRQRQQARAAPQGDELIEVLGRATGSSTSRISAGAPAPRLRRAPRAWRRRCPGASAPCRNWCRRRCSRCATYFIASPITAATCSGVSIVSVATSMTPISTSLPSSSFSTCIGTRELTHSTETCADAALGQRRKRRLVLPPFAPERRLPVDIGLDAVAVADVHGGGAGEPLDRAVQRLDAPAGDLVHVDVERRLVELDHVDAVGLRARAPRR